MLKDKPCTLHKTKSQIVFKKALPVIDREIRWWTDLAEYHGVGKRYDKAVQIRLKIEGMMVIRHLLSGESEYSDKACRVFPANDDSLEVLDETGTNLTKKALKGK